MRLQVSAFFRSALRTLIIGVGVAVLAIGMGVPVFAASPTVDKPLPPASSGGRMVMPLAPDVEKDLAYCRAAADQVQPPETMYINVGFGSIMGGALGALFGSFFGLWSIGASVGMVYGGVVGYFGGNAASEAIRDNVVNNCMAGRGHRA
jgi:uncharacterized protein YcfJ